MPSKNSHFPPRNHLYLANVFHCVNHINFASLPKFLLRRYLLPYLVPLVNAHSGLSSPSLPLLSSDCEFLSIISSVIRSLPVSSVFFGLQFCSHANFISISSIEIYAYSHIWSPTLLFFTHHLLVRRKSSVYYTSRPIKSTYRCLSLYTAILT